MKKILVVTGLALLTAQAVPAAAGLVDSPVPQLNGQKTSHIYSISGVVNAGGLGTYVSCTNASTDSAVVSVELFVDSGGAACNDASAVAITVASGVTVMFATQNVSSSFFSVAPMTTTPLYLPLGSARVLSTSKSLVCTAFLADAYSSPPTSMVPLHVVAKAKQRGD